MILGKYREWMIPEEILLKILSISRYIFIECIQEIFSSLKPCTSYWPWWKFHGYQNQVSSGWALRIPSSRPKGGGIRWFSIRSFSCPWSKVNVKRWKKRGISKLSRNNFTRYLVFKVKDSIKEPISMATDNRN